MDIKDILGEGYKEGMTVDEINVALADKELIDKSVLSGYVSKDTADKYATEAANFKKQLREKLTEDEAAKAKETEEREAMVQELESLKQKNAITENEKRLLAIGYDADLATKTAEAMANGDTQKVFDNQAKHIEMVQKNLRAELLKEMPTPPTGGGDSATMKEAFDKMTLTEKAKFKLEKPDEYKMIIGGNK
ncbi:MAG: hypothetical protein RR956_08025 [Christensenella sp.]